MLKLVGLLVLLMGPLAFAAIEPVNLIFAVPIMAVVVIIFLALTNMLANSISDPRLEAWVKTEIREFAAAIILVAAITAVFMSTSGFSIALAGGSDYLQSATGVLDKWIDKYDGAYIHVIKAAGKIRTAATYSPYMNIPLWYVSLSYSTNPLAGAAILLNGLSVAGQALVNVTFIAEGMRLLVVFLKVVGPKILLPLSFILRIIPFSRKLGNTMIAVSLAGMVFLPFSIIATDALNSTIDDINPRIDDLGALDAKPWAMIAAEPLCESAAVRTVLGLTDPVFSLLVCLPLMFIPIVGQGLFTACFNVVMYVVYPLMNVVFQGLMTLLSTLWETSLAGMEDYGIVAFEQVYPFLTEINNLVLLSYIDFILIAVITITGARSLSAALGGEWYMAGIQRLI